MVSGGTGEARYCPQRAVCGHRAGSMMLFVEEGWDCVRCWWTSWLVGVGMRPTFACLNIDQIIIFPWLPAVALYLVMKPLSFDRRALHELCNRAAVLCCFSERKVHEFRLLTVKEGARFQVRDTFFESSRAVAPRPPTLQILRQASGTSLHTLAA